MVVQMHRMLLLLLLLLLLLPACWLIWLSISLQGGGARRTGGHKLKPL